MKKTKHLVARQSQRGISSSMVNYVVNHGIDEKDKLILGKKLAQQRLNKLREEERLLKKILDKGGIVVIIKGDSLITTYNYKP